jgi:hypothetical protein
MMARQRRKPAYQLVTCAALLGATFATVKPLPARQRVEVQTSDSAIVALAAFVAGAAERVSHVWPGFWSEQEGFILADPGKWVVLYTTVPPPPRVRGIVFAREDDPQTSRTSVRSGGRVG